MDLKRYLSEDEGRSLLAGFAGLLPGGQAAVYNLKGQRLAWVGPGTGCFADLSGPILDWLSGAGPLQPYLGEGVAIYSLHLDLDKLGCLVVQEPGPAAEALQAGLLLLIQNGFEKRRLVGETLEGYREVNLLYRLAERLGSNLDEGGILQIVLVEAKRVIPATCGVILLAAPPADPAGRRASFGPPADAQVVGAVLEELARQSPPPSTVNILTGLGSPECAVEAVLYAPLFGRDGFKGLLALGRSAGLPQAGRPAFTAGEMKLLLALAGHTAIAVETAWLHQQALLHQRIEQELKIGQRIQRSLLPKSMPTIPGWELTVCYEAASQVGGDFYDVIPLPGELNCLGGPCYGITIADVTGKGIPAALMMAFSKGILHTAALSQAGPARMLRQANEAIMHSSHSGLLVTVFYGILDPCSGLLRYGNAGHEPPIHSEMASGKLSDLSGGRSLIMGALAEFLYTEAEIQIQPGDALLFYTDGVTEARNSAGDFFAEERLYEALSGLHSQSGAEILDGLRKRISEFTSGAQQSDDITMVFLRRLG